MKTLFLMLFSLPILAASPLKKEGKSFQGSGLKLSLAFFEKESHDVLAQYGGPVAKKFGIDGKVIKLTGTPEGNGAYYMTEINKKPMKVLTMVNGFVGPMYTSHLLGKDEILKEDGNLSRKVRTDAMWAIYNRKK